MAQAIDAWKKIAARPRYETTRADIQDLSATAHIMYIDYLRVLSMFGVIVIHVAGLWTSGAITSNEFRTGITYMSLGRFAVPVFFMISGALTLKPEKEIDFVDEWKAALRKACRLAIVLVAWVMIYATFFALREYFLGTKTVVDIPQLLRSYADVFFGPVGYGWYHLWYLYAAIGLYLLTPMIRRLLQGFSTRYAKYILFVFLASLSINAYNKLLCAETNILGLDNPLTALDWRFPSACYVGFFIIGWVLANIDISRRATICLYLLGVASFIITIVGTLTWSALYDSKQYFLQDPTSPTTLFEAMAIFLFAKNHVNNNPSKSAYLGIGEGIRAISRRSLGVYVSHYLFALPVGYMWFPGFWGKGNPVAMIPLCCAITFFASFVLTAAIEKIPLIGKRIV